MSQKINKLIVFAALLIFIGVIGWSFIKYSSISIRQAKNKMVIGFEILGIDPETGQKGKYLPVEGVLITAKIYRENKWEEIEQQITDKDGRVVFKLDKGYPYVFEAQPFSILSSLYIYSDFPYVIEKGFETEGEYLIRKKLKLTEEAKRDIQRRNDLLVIKEALERYKELTGQYPLGKNIPLMKDNVIYKRIISILSLFYKETGAELVDPVNEHPYHYKYSSDGNTYILAALPEKDRRSEIEILKKYKNMEIYLIGDTNLDINF